jgi:ketosteroid isomerase-like protein
MKVTIAVLLFTVSAAAQMTNAALLKLDREFAQATASEHLDGWMKYMMDYTVIFGTQGESQIVSGKEEIRTYYRELFSRPDFKMNWTPMSAQLLPTGATGYTRGTFHWVMPNNRCTARIWLFGRKKDSQAGSGSSRLCFHLRTPTQ